MPKDLLVVVALAAACASLAAAQTNGPAARGPARETAPAAAPLNEQERRGRDLYERGVSPSGGELFARVGEAEVPASGLKCAECHGLRGEGITEDGVAAGALTWKHLTGEDGHTHPTGRRHGPFDESTFARAVAYGLDPDDNELHVAMPRYGLPKKDLADLVAYLKRVGEEPAPDDNRRPAAGGPQTPTNDRRPTE